MQRPLILKGHERPLTFVKYNRDGDLLFTCSKDHKPCVWFASNGERLGTYNGHEGAIWSLDVTADSKYLMTGSADRTARIWDVQSGNSLAVLQHASPVRCVEYAEGARMALTVGDKSFGQDPTIFLWDLSPDNWKNQNSIASMSLVGIEKINCARWGPLNDTIVSGGVDGTVRIWNTETGDEIGVLADHEKSVNCIQFSPDFTMFLTCSEDQTAILYDTKSLQIIRTFESDRPLNACAFAPNLKYVVLGGGQEASAVTNTAARVGKFDAQFFSTPYAEMVGTVRGHFGPINSLCVSSDGKSFATGAEDGYIRLHHYDADMNKTLKNID